VDYDTTLALQERVTDLVSRMTLEEKISQMVFDAPAIERLGIPAYNWWNECLHGVARAGVATVFPQAIGLAATWDTDLMGRLAKAISDEARAKHHEAERRGICQIYTGLTYWSPNVNIFRDPRWGRGQETYGEDPYLTAQMGVIFVKGLQGDDPHYLKLVATPKHYAVHSGPEPERHRFDAVVSERDMRETYLPAFEACIREGKAVSIMGAYNRVNGEPACASPTLLQQILRAEWGFGGPDGLGGYVVSDCWAIIDIYAHHKVVQTAEEAAALAVKNGCELNCGSTYPALRGAVEQGLIDEATIDRALERLLVARFRLGMFDPPEKVPYAQIPLEIVGSGEHRTLALRAAQESIVLLKNDGLLPLSKEIDSIAVIGPNADELSVLLGNYNGTAANAVTPLDGIRRRVSPQTTVYYAQGCGLADGVPVFEVIPQACLRPAEADAGESGLTAEYYDNAELAGAPAQRRLDRTVNFTWKGTTPLSGQWGDKFGVSWRGFLVPPATGVYDLGVKGFSGYKLYLDGDLIVTREDPRLQSRRVELERGRLYDLRLEFWSKSLDPHIELLWARPGVDHEALALEVADKADVVVAVMGLSPTLEGEEMPVQVDGFAGGDRTDIALPRPQRALLERLHELGKPVVLVLISGSALAVPWAAEHIPAIIQAWYPGESGGGAVADVLFGDYNPSGRLPVTIYESVDDLPPFEEYAMAGRTYRYFTGKPLFAFGHGLSYTHFLFDNLQISPGRIQAGDQVTVGCDVTNAGDRAGDEVVQLYIRHRQALVPRPIQELKGFARITLKPGETKRVTFVLHTDLLAIYDKDVRQVVQPGTIDLMLGSASDCLPLTGQLEVIGHPAKVGSAKTFFSIAQVE
jgi:beta-glucosidase